MYEYEYTVMSHKVSNSYQKLPKATKTLKHQMQIKTGNTIYRHKVNQSKCNQSCMIDTFLLFSSLACLSTSIMSKGEPSMRELRLDYTIDCPVYLEW